MRAGNYVLSESEERRVLEIYNRFKQTFNDCKLSERKNIIGIGEDGKQLMCYFTYFNSGILVKFKNIDQRFHLFDNAVDENIDKTIELFQNNEFLLKRKTTDLNSFLSKESKNFNMPLDIVKEEFEKSMCSLDASFNNLPFDACSNKLKNVLYKNEIYNIGKLRTLSFEQILNLKSFGSKCLWELCEFLSNLNEATLPSPSCKNGEASLQMDMINYINKISKKAFVCDISNSLNKYLTNKEKYRQIYIELIDYISKASLHKLTPREQSIFNARLGINEEPKTLQGIGEYHSITKERVRQIVAKVTKTLNNKKMSSLEFVKLEYQKCRLLETINEISTSGFLAYVYFEIKNIELLKFIYFLFFKKKIELNYIKNEFEKQCSENKRQEIYAKYNEKILNLISFDKKKTITDEDFNRLKNERLNSNRLLNLSYNNSTYQYEYEVEKTLLKRFLSHNTFKKIKTQSLKIPFNNSSFCSDFQCLTHDNHLVIIEIKSLLNMCEAQNIIKFHALKDFCEKYGFGYLVMDDKNNSFFKIDEPNPKFNELILNELNDSPWIKYNRYKEIRQISKASIKNFLTLIKTENLKFSLPFKITR